MRVRRICKEYGVVEPVFQEISNGFLVTLFKELLNLADNDLDDIYSVPDNDTLNDTLNQNVPVNVPVNDPNSVEIKILNEIRQDNSIVLSAIAVKLAVNIKTVKRYVQKLKQKGLLQRIGPDKGGCWLVTDK